MGCSLLGGSEELHGASALKRFGVAGSTTTSTCQSTDMRQDMRLIQGA